jgi:dipeptidase E
MNLMMPYQPLKAQKNFTGGGNTFVLVAELYKNNIMNALAASIKGTPYLGTSARQGVAG